MLIYDIKCDALFDLVSFVQFTKREKHPWKSVNFSKVAGFSLGYEKKKMNDAAENINNLAMQNHLLITGQEIHNVNKLNSKKN